MQIRLIQYVFCVIRRSAQIFDCLNVIFGFRGNLESYWELKFPFTIEVQYTPSIYNSCTQYLYLIKDWNVCITDKHLLMKIISSRCMDIISNTGIANAVTENISETVMLFKLEFFQWRHTFGTRNHCALENPQWLHLPDNVKYALRNNFYIQESIICAITDNKLSGDT